MDAAMGGISSIYPVLAVIAARSVRATTLARVATKIVRILGRGGAALRHHGFSAGFDSSFFTAC
jgi:hypothetical protein